MLTQEYINEQRRIISDNLIRIRNDRELSQQELADLCGINLSDVILLELAKEDFLFELLFDFSNGLKVTVSDLILAHK